jgi:hypothetical protein
MSQKRFEPTIPVFERAKTVHALDRAATVIGKYMTALLNYSEKIDLLFQSGTGVTFQNQTDSTVQN